MTSATEMQTLVERLKADMARLNDVVNGPASGDGSIVELEAGDAKTVLRTLSEIEARFFTFDSSRPGDCNAALNYSQTKTGAADAKPDLGIGETAVHSQYGSVYVIDGADIPADPGYVDIARKINFPLTLGRTYRLSVEFFRETDATDPAGATVRVFGQNLNSTKGAISVTQFGNDYLPHEADGLQTLTVHVGLPGAENLDYELPSDARYLVPFIRIYGNDQRLAIVRIAWSDTSETGLKGDPGITDIGEFDPDSVGGYARGEAVRLDGSTFLARDFVPSGVEPQFDADGLPLTDENWQVLASRGHNAWTPRFVEEEISASRTVLRLDGYFGGQGDAPTENVGKYVGDGEFVDNEEDALNRRGPQGIQGDPGEKGDRGDATNPRGVYSGGETYVALDSVTGADGYSYYLPAGYVGTVSGTAPPSSPWVLDPTGKAAQDAQAAAEVVEAQADLLYNGAAVYIAGLTLTGNITDVLTDENKRVISFYHLDSQTPYLLNAAGDWEINLSYTQQVESLHVAGITDPVGLDVDPDTSRVYGGTSHVMTPTGLSPAMARGDQTVFDVVVYGGTPAGIMAALRCARRGLRVCVLEPSPNVGGLIAGGLCWTDDPPQTHSHLVTGMTMQFFEAMASYPYSVPSASATNSRWALEPKTAAAFLRQMLFDSGATVMTNARLERGDVLTFENAIQAVKVNNTLIRGRFWINASYEGDLGYHAGVSYTYGRESSALYGETLAGFRPDVAYSLDGYTDLSMVPGYPGGSVGDADNLTQAYNFRITGTKASDRLPWPEPEGYDPDDPFLSLLLQTLIIKEAQTGQAVRLTNVSLPSGAAFVFGADPLPNGKYDLNNSLIVGADCIGLNTAYPMATWAQRDTIYAAHVLRLQSTMYFLANDPRVNATTQADVNLWGLAADEFVGSPNGDGWTPALYIREGRRMVGKHVLIQQDQESPDNTKATRAISWLYNFRDVHGVQYYVDPADSNKLRLEGNTGEDPDFTAYDIPFESLIPDDGEITNFVDCVTISSSHVAYAATRMEPAYMMMGEACAELAVYCLRTEKATQDYDYDTVRAALDEFIRIRE